MVGRVMSQNKGEGRAWGWAQGSELDPKVPDTGRSCLLLRVVLTAGTCEVVSGLSRLSVPFFPSRPSTLHHSLQEESGVSVSASGPRRRVKQLYVL